jgi:hypothetical protein
MESRGSTVWSTVRYCTVVHGSVDEAPSLRYGYPVPC